MAYLQSATSGSDLTTYTFSSQNLGTAGSGRYIVVGIAARALGTVTLSSVTVGGVTATILKQVTNTASNSVIAGAAIAYVPTGTTGDVVVTFSAGALRCSVFLYSFNWIGSAAAYDTDAKKNRQTLNFSVKVPEDGHVIGVVCTGHNTSTSTWTGLTEDADAVIGGETSRASCASDSPTSAQDELSITDELSGSGTTNTAGVVVVLSPDAGRDNATDPELDSATVSTDGDSITLQFNESVYSSGGGDSGFTLDASGGAVTMTYVSGNGTGVMVYSLSRTISNGETITIDYAGASGDLLDADDNELADITDGAVVNTAGVAVMTHLLGIGGVTTTTAKYRARTDAAETIKIEYSTNSDLSSSSTSTGVTTASGDDFTGGEEITGLSANTVYYYSILVDDIRQHSAPFPSFKTMPSAGTDLKVVFGSCTDSPADTEIFQSIQLEDPYFILHLGDYGYIDSTVVATQRTGRKDMLTDDWYQDVVARMARVHGWDDHDYATDDSNGDVSGKANSLQVYKEYLPSHDLENASNGIWHSFVVGDAEFFLLDTRYQREGTKSRFPSSSTNTADTGSSGTSLVLRSADSPSGSDDNYNGWYVEVEGVVRRITDYVGATRTCTLSESVPGLDSSSTYYLRRASMLDMDYIADDQLDWLIAGVNGSSATWKFICSSVLWNPTSTTLTDTWGGWDSDQIERKYISQEITADNVVVLSGDRHASAIDDGTNSLWPECSVSPFRQFNITIPGSWSEGTNTSGYKYGLIEIDGTSKDLTLTVKDVEGNTSSGITPLTVTPLTATVTGTATATINESDVVTGGKTIIITLTGDTWAAAGTGPIGSTADTQAIIDGISAASSPANGWNDEWRDKEVTTAVVRTSDTVCTITMSSQATISGTYDISSQETITVTVPAAALVTSGSPIVATPTFTVDAVGATTRRYSLTLSGVG